jgi:hypothetical protein
VIDNKFVILAAKSRVACTGGPPWPPLERIQAFDQKGAATESHPYRPSNSIVTIHHTCVFIHMNRRYSQAAGLIF